MSEPASDRDRRRLSNRWWLPAFTGVTALGLAAFMSGVVTALNTGLDAGFGWRWLRAFAVAYPLAWLAAMIWAPIARRIVLRIVDPPSGG